MWKCTCNRFFDRQLINISISALAKEKSAIMNPVAGAVLAEERGMNKRDDQPDQVIHCPLPHYQMLVMRLVTKPI